MATNRLHNYVNYAYRLEMWACKANELQGSEMLIADSGVGGNRSADFPLDLHIENLEMSSLVGLTARGRNTDVVNFTFDVIEPYTNRFLAQILKTHARLNPGAQWNSCFFAMKIQWLGYTDDGNPTGVIASKVIPFTMTGVQMKILNGSTVYSCRAIPTSHYALNPAENLIPFHLELQGTTVQHILAGPNTQMVKSLKDTLNQAEQEMQAKLQKVEQANTYLIELPGEIADAKVSTDNRKQFQTFSLPDAKNAGAWQQMQKGFLPLEIKNNVFRVASGTKITDFINTIIGYSSYMKDQVGGKEMKLWKINVDTQFVKWDKKRNDWQKVFTYKVVTYPVKGISPPHITTKKVTIDDCVRVYDYLYTGLNQDILRLDMDFKTAFWTARNASHANYDAQDSNTIGPTKEGQQPEEPDINGTTKNPLQLDRKMIPARGLANRQNTGPMTDNIARMSVDDIMQYVYDHNVDMVTLEIQIVGDPDWISSNNINLKDAIDFTSSDQFVFVRSRAPKTDYQDDGLFDVGDASFIQGVYKIISVKSSFRNGSFTQLLRMIRSTTQDDSTTQKTQQSGQRDSNITDATGTTGGNAGSQAGKRDSNITDATGTTGGNAGNTGKVTLPDFGRFNQNSPM